MAATLTTEQVFANDFKTLWATNFLTDLSIETVDYPFSNGVIGLETSLALTLALVRAGELSLGRAVERLTVGPARCFDLSFGTLAAGAPADVVVVDAEREWKVDPQRFYSRSRNSPFSGWTLRGKAVRTFVAGKPVHEEGK